MCPISHQASPAKDFLARATFPGHLASASLFHFVSSQTFVFHEDLWKMQSEVPQLRSGQPMSTSTFFTIWCVEAVMCVLHSCEEPGRKAKKGATNLDVTKQRLGFLFRCEIRQCWPLLKSQGNRNLAPWTFRTWCCGAAIHLIPPTELELEVQMGSKDCFRAM